MFKKIKQLRDAWRIAGNDLPLVERLVNQIKENQDLANNGVPLVIQPDELREMLKVDLPLGDGGAVFFPEATEQEYADFLREEEHGWKHLFNKKKP